MRGCVDVKYSWAGLAAAFEQLQTLQTDARMHRNYTSGLLQNLLGLQWNSGTFLLNFFFFRLYSYDTHMISYMILIKILKKDSKKSHCSTVNLAIV